MGLAAMRDFGPANVGSGVRLGHSALSARCPVCPKAAIYEQRVRNGNAKRPGGLEVDHQLLVIIKGLEDAFLFCSRRAANCRSLTYVRTCREIPEQLLRSCFQREPHSQRCVGGVLFIFREARRLDFLTGFTSTVAGSSQTRIQTYGNFPSGDGSIKTGPRSS